MRIGLLALDIFRSPMKSVVTFVLLLATSFAFVSRGAEYAATVAEIEKAEAQYTAVGTLQRTTDGYTEYMENLLGEEVYELEGGAYIDRLSNAIAPLEQEVIDLVLGSEHIAESEFIMVAGGLTSESLRNVLEQPLVDVPYYWEWEWYSNGGTFEMDSAFLIVTNTGNGTFAVDEVIVGENPEIYRRGQKISLLSSIQVELNSLEATSFQNGHRYFLAITTFLEGIKGTSKNIITDVDYPVIDLTVLEEKYGVTDYVEALSNPSEYGLMEYADSVVSTLEYLDVLYRNFHTQELVHISDMSTLQKYHNGELYIVDGRAVNSEDNSLVCVVSTDYAERNHLTVGDAIEFEMSADTMMHSGKVFGREPPVAAHRTTAGEQQLTDRGLEPVAQSYEIVGIWSDSSYEVADPFSYSPNTVFVPASTYPWPGEVEPTLLPSTFSFTLNHPGDMEKVQEELGSQLAELGYEFVIDDMGYADAQHSLNMMKVSALIGFVTMGAALLLALLLITYLFIIRRKYDYAIMRALGTPVPRANRSLLTGLFTLAILAVLLGCIAALVMAQSLAADLSAQLAEITGTAAASTMPAWLVGAFGAGVLGLLLIFARVGLTRIGKKSPLALLQGGR